MFVWNTRTTSTLPTRPRSHSSKKEREKSYIDENDLQTRFKARAKGNEKKVERGSIQLRRERKTVDVNENEGDKGDERKVERERDVRHVE